MTVLARGWCGLPGLLALWAAACMEPAAGRDRTEASEFLAALAAPAGGPRDLALYDRFVGAWNADVTVFPDSGPPIRGRGEWLFARVMEGRAIQDLFIVPARPQRDSATTGPYGTTIRFPGPADSTWLVTWLNPVNGSVTRMTARREGSEIVQRGIDDDGHPFRWVFYRMEPSRFLWRAEDSTDARGWVRLQEMVVTRRTPPSRP